MYASGGSYFVQVRLTSACESRMGGEWVFVQLLKKGKTETVINKNYLFGNGLQEQLVKTKPEVKLNTLL